MQKRIGYLFLLCVLLGAMLGFLVFIAKNTAHPPPSLPTQSTITPTLPPAITKIPQNVSTFTDPKGIYTIAYPKDFTLDQQNNGQYTRIYRNGATQQGQTEQHDGVTISMETIDLQGKTLSQRVDEKIQTSTADGTLQLTKPKEPITINTAPGFTYRARGLGEATYVIVQKNIASSYGVSITYMVNDPQNKGYQGEVDRILASLTLSQ